MSGKINNWDTLRAATINGARALKMEGKTGSVMEGKSADIVLLSTDELGMSPLRENNLVPLLIYSGNTQNVKYVLSGAASW
jgi:5-methylthioadenosine/S-adenosylhomocysteine deaminase